MRRAAIHLADAPTADWFAAWAKKELEERAARPESAVSFWRAASDSAPAMGMTGTVVGLVGLFIALDDPATLGPATALRPEERCVGKECVSACRYRWSQDTEKRTT